MWQLSILYPDDTRATCELTEPQMTIGRHADNSIQIPDETISGRHAEVVQTKERLLLRDLDSTNGTFIDGVAVREKELSTSCKVTFGSVECAFDFLDDAKPGDTRPQLEEARKQLDSLARANEEKVAQLVAEHEKRMEEIEAGYEQQLASAVLERRDILRREEEMRARLAKSEEEHKRAAAARESAHHERLTTITRERDELAAMAASLQKRMEAIEAEDEQAQEKEEELTTKLKRAEAALESRSAEQDELKRKLDDACERKAHLEKEQAALTKALEEARSGQEKLRKRVEEQERAAARPKTEPMATGGQNANAETALSAAMHKIEALESSNAVLRTEARRAQESAASDKQQLSAANSSLNERITAADKENAELREKLAQKETGKPIEREASVAGTSRSTTDQERHSSKLFLITTAAACLAVGFAFGFAAQAGFFTRPTAVATRTVEEKPQAPVTRKKELSRRSKPAVDLRPLEEPSNTTAVTNKQSSPAAVSPRNESPLLEPGKDGTSNTVQRGSGPWPLSTAP